MEFYKTINIAVDCDELLTYISPWWIYLLSESNYEYFSKYLYIPRKFYLKGNDVKKTLLRPYFRLEDSYGTDYFKSLDKNSNEYECFLNRFYEVYDRNSFYTKLCKPTKMAYTIKSLLNTDYVKKVDIVSKSFKHNKDGKRKFLTDFFGDEFIKNKKLEIHILDNHEKKSDCINSFNYDINAFFDDELNNIRDVITNCKNQMDIYIPMLGYNRPDRDETDIIGLSDLALENNKNVEYYQVIDGLLNEVNRNLQVNDNERMMDEFFDLIDDNTDLSDVETIKIEDL